MTDDDKAENGGSDSEEVEQSGGDAEEPAQKRQRIRVVNKKDANHGIPAEHNPTASRDATAIKQYIQLLEKLSMIQKGAKVNEIIEKF